MSVHVAFTPSEGVAARVGIVVDVVRGGKKLHRVTVHPRGGLGPFRGLDAAPAALG